LDAPENRPRPDDGRSPPNEATAPTRQRLHDDEIDVDIELVRGLVAAQFPRWAELSLTEVASAGTVNAIYRLGPEFMVRLPRAHRFAKDVESDLEVLVPLAGRLPLPIPEILAMGTPTVDYPFAWGVYRWIEGQSWSTQPPDDLHRAASDLADFVQSLQAVDPTGVRAGWRGWPLVDIDDLFRTGLARSQELFPTEAVLRAWDVSVSAPGWTGAPVWLHGDLLPTNLVVADGHLRGVIDFGCCGIGDPAIEYSTAWTLFPPEVRREYRELLDVDDATWLRARGWALSHGVGGYAYYRHTNPEFAGNAWRTLEAVLAEVDEARS
jgi:aminoglycoside phosphotransferase (APT) family kinase protein